MSTISYQKRVRAGHHMASGRGLLQPPGVSKDFMKARKARRDEGGIDRELGAVREGEAVGDDARASPPSLATHSGDSVLEREGSAGKRAGGGARGPVVAEHFEQHMAAAVTRRKWQAQARTSQKQHPGW